MDAENLHRRLKKSSGRCRQSCGVAIGIGADNGVQKILWKGQGRSVCFHGGDFLPAESHSVEKQPVFLRVTPKIRCVDRKTVLPCEKDAGQSLTAAQIANHGAPRNSAIQQEFLRQLDGVGPHDFGHQLRGAVCLTFDGLHGGVLFKAKVNDRLLKHNK